MLQYVLAGLALGSIYAIAAASLTVTFVSAGVLNFAFGAMAYFVARFYYFLNSQHGWPTYSAGLVSILVVGPLLGVVLYALLFRFIRGKSTLVKVVATIGLFVALPPVADITMGTQSITSAPGLASLSDQPYHFFGSPVTTDQLITYGFLLFVLIVGTVLLRFTDVGLKVRALVDSEAMASLSGTNPGRVALGVWAITTALAGLAGILVAPSQGLNTGGMSALMAAAFAAVVVARLRSLPIAVIAALAMGVVTDVIQKYLPANSSLTAAIIPSIPFAFILVALIVYLIRSGTLDEGAGVAGPLDQAIRPATQDAEEAGTEVVNLNRRGMVISALPLLLVAFLPLILKAFGPYWLGQGAWGLCYAVTFLTFTVVTGEGGMLWLSQVMFAATGAMAGAQFVTYWHVPVLLAIVIAAFIASIVGSIIGVLTIRLGDLYVALTTFTFSLIVEQLVFTRNRFLQGGIGLPFYRPSWATSDLALAYLALGVFLIFAILTVNLRRSTSGMALRAVRDSEAASRTLGLSVLQVKVIIGALAAFVAAVGGGFLAMYANEAQPQSFDTYQGLVWLAVVVTLGIRTITGAAIAGMAFTLFNGVFTTYVPARWGEVPTILFGLGAIGVAQNPEGAVVVQGRAIRGLLMGKSRTRPGSAPDRGAPTDGPAPPVMVGTDSTGFRAEPAQ
jgi:branched-chain amino acid transport system permease protein